MQRVRTLGELKQANYQTRKVKDEMRSNPVPYTHLTLQTTHPF